MRKLSPPLAWTLIAAAASAAMLITAHVFQHFGYEPCNLCLRQREVYWAVLGVAGGGLVLWRLGRLTLEVLCILLGGLFLASLLTAGFHAGVEWKWWPGPAACAASAVGTVTTDDLTMLLAGSAKVKAPSCDDAAWRLAGLSMAGWNALVSMGLAAMTFAVARGGRR